MRSTNYYNTFISVSETCTKDIGTVPLQKEPATVAGLMYEIISNNPYAYTSDEMLFEIYKKRYESSTMQDFLQTSQACLRCSPLAKNYGWGIHCDANGRVALYGVESKEYGKFLDNGEIEHKHAFSSNK